MFEPERDEIERFLSERVTTYDQLALLHLLVQGRGRAHLPGELSSALGMSPAAVATALEHLRASGLVRYGEPVAGQATYEEEQGPETPLIESVMRVYETDRSSLMKILSQNAIARVRAKAATAFSQPPRKKRD